MIDVPTLFNLQQVVNEPEDVMYLSLLEPEAVGITSVAPWFTFVASRKAAERDPSGLNILRLFPTERDFKGGARTFRANMKVAIERKDLTPILEDHQIIPVERVSSSEVSRISNTVNTSGGVTFFIKGQDEAIMFTQREVLKILSKYRYKALIGCRNYIGRTKVVEENLALLVSFFHLHHAIPVLNPKKTDGFGVMMRLIQPNKTVEKRKMSLLDASAFVVANHEDNIAIVDGVRVREVRTKLQNVDSIQGNLKSALEYVKQGTKNRDGGSKKGLTTNYIKLDESSFQQYYGTGTSASYTTNSTNSTSSWR